ncbi:MAG: tRNA glutamyl-Q(34) synthetase GluQRS [Magnetococcus sp. WYHC-3]
MTMRTRFAPSPTGRLHLGHAFSALTAWQRVRQEGGVLVLRIEDIDGGRCRAEFETALMEDLAWLGLVWETPVRRQSEHLEDYRVILEHLHQRGLLYPCFCTRSDILREAGAATSAPHGLPPPYPGICRHLDPRRRQQFLEEGRPHAWRLDSVRALGQTGALSWRDDIAGDVPATPEWLGDVVLARKDTPVSYHLAVTHDDHLQGITHVIRGQDLFHATHVQRLLQALMGWDPPRYHHHPLITDARGIRLAKRNQAETLQSLRAAGATPGDIRQRLGWCC